MNDDTDEPRPPGPGGSAPGGDDAMESAATRFRRYAGASATERAAPSLTRALGAGGALLGGAGVLILGVDAVAGDGGRGLATVLAVAYGLTGGWLLLRREPAFRTAGATALTVAIPAALGFLVLARASVSPDDFTLVVALSTIALGALYLAGPGRGHPVLLGASLVGAWLTVTLQLGSDFLGFGLLDVTGFGGIAQPDTTSSAIASLVFGAGYLLAGDALDRASLRGTATAFVGAGILATVVGVGQATVGRPAWLAGLTLVVAGALMGFVGSRRGRRVTTWIGAATIVFGIGSLVEALVDDEVVIAGVVLLASGTVLVNAAPLLAHALGEPALREPHPPESS